MKIFIEQQRMTQWWIHAILILSLGVPLVMTGEMMIASGGQDQDLLIGTIVLFVAMALTYFLIFSMKLKTRIDEHGIHYQFWPFHRAMRVVAWKDIEAIEIRKYKAIVEYGGWGLRSHGLKVKRLGVAYTMKGNLGIQLVLKTGKKILIGTQQEQDVNRTLATYQSKLSSYEN